MKYTIFILFIVIGVSHGFFGSIGQSINNLGNTGNELIKEVGKTGDEIKNEVDKTIDEVKKQGENLVGQILDIANGIRFSAIFLWDTVFSPTFDMMIQDGNAFLNDTFGAIANMNGQPMSIPENPLSDKYAQLIALFKSNIHHLYEQLFLIEQEALKAIEGGQTNFEERIRALSDKFEAIKKQIEEWAMETKTQLEAYALTIAGEWEVILNQYKENIDLTISSMEKMFGKITENLLKNFLDFVSNVVPNANNIIENMKTQGSLPFIRN